MNKAHKSHLKQISRRQESPSKMIGIRQAKPMVVIYGYGKRWQENVLFFGSLTRAESGTSTASQYAYRIGF